MARLHGVYETSARMTTRERDPRERLRRALQHAPEPGPPFPCSYLPDRLARHQTLLATDLPPGVYHALMDLNFRRMGELVYRPVCDACRACRQIRVPVRAFEPSRAQRRCRARNVDVVATTGEPALTDEKADLYRRYLAGRHDGQMDGSADELAAVPVRRERAHDRDLLPARGPPGRRRHRGRRAAGAVRRLLLLRLPTCRDRGLGVLNVLRLIEEARRRDVEYLYLGYFVAGARTMEYKAGYRPCEALTPEGRWEAPRTG